MSFIGSALGATVLGGVISGAGAVIGANKQASASKRASQMQMDQFNLLNSQQQPFIQSGYGAMGKLNTLLGLSPRPSTGGGGGGGIPGVPIPQRPGFVPTPGVSGQPPAQIKQNPWQMAAGPQPPADNVSLRRILALRAQHGDTQAARVLGLV